MSGLPLHSLRFENPSAPPLVILHGLLGSSRNWTTIGRALAENFDVHALDLRNHGQSPHADSMSWENLSADVATYLDAHALQNATLMGHSLGGKIAMRQACDAPDRIARLAVVDIAAKRYPPYHLPEFEAMRRVPVDRIDSRKEAEAILGGTIGDWAMRQFLMTNLVRNDAGGFRWQINLAALDAALPRMAGNSLEAGMQYAGPSLLIAGGRSQFLAPGDAEAMKTYLPRLEVHTLPEAGHNVHIDDRSGFLEALRNWWG